MLRTLIILITLCGIQMLSAQTISFSLEVDHDTIKVGDVVTVIYTLKGARGDFQEPEFTDLRLVGGPSFSSNISIINGKMDQTFTYSYVFQLIAEGDFIIPAASVAIDGELHVSPSVQLHVLPNAGWIPNESSQLRPKRHKSTKDKNVTEI